MTLDHWLSAAKGRATAMAQHFGVTPAAVAQWKSSRVPVDKMKAVRDYTNGEVSLDDMVPEIQEVRDAA